MSKTAELTLEIASKMYQGTDESLRDFALKNFPELGMKITDRVKTFEEACKLVGRDPASSFFTSEALRPHEIAQRKIETIVKALNEGWKPNWDDSDEYKYRPWFKMSSSGSGFSYNDYDYDNTNSNVSSHQCYIPEAQTLPTVQKTTLINGR